MRSNYGQEQEIHGQTGNSLLTHLDRSPGGGYTVWATPGRWIASRQIVAMNWDGYEQGQPGARIPRTAHRYVRPLSGRDRWRLSKTASADRSPGTRLPPPASRLACRSARRSRVLEKRGFLPLGNGGAGLSDARHFRTR